MKFAREKGVKTTYLNLKLIYSGAPEQVWIKKFALVIDEDWIRDQLCNLEIHKFMDLDGMHPQVLWKLEDVITRPLSFVPYPR